MEGLTLIHDPHLGMQAFNLSIVDTDARECPLSHLDSCNLPFRTVPNSGRIQSSLPVEILNKKAHLHLSEIRSWNADDQFL